MEGRVYNCTWTKDGGTFRVWVESNQKLRAEGKTLVEADEALWGVICEQIGDGENVREYQPPFPATNDDARYLTDGLLMLLANSRGEKISALEPLFSEGLCSECGGGLGERTEVPLTVDYIESGFDSVFVPLTGSSFHLYSEDFLSLLHSEESARFVWRPVQRRKGSRKAFFECVGTNPVPFVAIRGIDPVGWECGQCGHKVFGLWPENLSFTHVVCSASLPRPIPSCFPVGPMVGAHVCVERERWESIRGQRGARGLVSDPLAVVSAADAEPHSNLPRRYLTREGDRPRNR